MSDIQPVPNALLGIEVSHYQGVIDWPKVADAGVKFVFIKATDGATVADPMAKTNASGAAAAGLPFGFYHFWRPTDDWRAQAEFFLSVIDDATPLANAGLLPNVLDTEVGSLAFLPPQSHRARKLPNVLDIEVGSLSEDNQGDALSWLKAAPGQTAIVYVSPSYARFNLTDPAWIQYSLWSAHYTDLMQPNIDKWPSWMFWQRQGNGSIDGISGPVDIDWFNGSESDLQKLIAVETESVRANEATLY